MNNTNEHLRIFKAFSKKVGDLLCRFYLITTDMNKEEVLEHLNSNLNLKTAKSALDEVSLQEAIMWQGQNYRYLYLKK